MKTSSVIRSKNCLPEMRARPFDRRTDSPSQIENLLPRRQQAQLQAIATVLDYQRANNTIFSEGEDAHFVYSVASGVVRISRHTENGRRQILALMLPGHLFGIPEAGLYANSAETVCPTTLYRVPWERLHEMMLEEPEMQVSSSARGLRPAPGAAAHRDVGPAQYHPEAGILPAGACPTSRFLQSPYAPA